MARPKKAAKKTADLVDKLDAEAMALLDIQKDTKLVLETRLAIFANVTRWAAVRNKFGENPEQEDLLGAYRRSIETASEAVERAGVRGPGNRHHRGDGSHRPGDFESPNSGDSYNGGPALEALKSRLPGADDGDADGDSRSGSGENPVIAGANRLIRPRLSSDDAIDFDEPHSDGDF